MGIDRSEWVTPDKLRVSYYRETRPVWWPRWTALDDVFLDYHPLTVAELEVEAARVGLILVRVHELHDDDGFLDAKIAILR